MVAHLLGLGRALAAVVAAAPGSPGAEQHVHPVAVRVAVEALVARVVVHADQPLLEERVDFQLLVVAEDTAGIEQLALSAQNHFGRDHLVPRLPLPLVELQAERLQRVLVDVGGLGEISDDCLQVADVELRKRVL